MSCVTIGEAKAYQAVGSYDVPHCLEGLSLQISIRMQIKWRDSVRG